MMCCKPWIVQPRSYGASFCFATKEEAAAFASTFEKVHCGPYYSVKEGLASERYVLEMVVLIVENEFRANRNRRNS